MKENSDEAQEETVRGARFGDATTYLGLELAPTARGYFSGRGGDDRMAAIRNTIEKVRRGWSSQTGVPEAVSSFVAKLVRETASKHDAALAAAGTAVAGTRDWRTTWDALMRTIAMSFEGNQRWADRSNQRVSKFPLLALYTSKLGYDELFAAVNDLYRRGDPLLDAEQFEAMTWLVELMNMELFALDRTPPAHQDSQIVYRGLHVPTEMEKQFCAFAGTIEPSERSVSIPLSFQSTSWSLEEALRFFRQKPTLAQGSERLNVMWRIRIATLSQRRLSAYHRHFPTSVVTRLCATDISRLSHFQKEQEVLLRGPFFEVIHSTWESDPESGRYLALDAIMLDNNRDHISELELGDQREPARALFSALVRAERSELAGLLAAELGRDDLVHAYEQMAEKWSGDAYALQRG